MEFVMYLALILLTTKVAGDLSVRIGQPAVLGKLIVGILLGPALLGWIESNEFIYYISEIGVLLLMFIAGLETDIDQLKSNWKSAFAVALGGIILPFIGGFYTGEWFGLVYEHSLFFAVLFCATSVSISVQVLKEMNQLNSREGTTILGAAVVDDVLVVILLAFIMSLLGEGGANTSIGLLIGKKVIFFAIITAASIYIVPRFMKLMSKLQVTESTISAALIVCFSFAYFADLMQMAGIIGAFAAGIAVSQTPYQHEVEKKVEPIAYSVFVPIFFVSIGLNVSFDGISNQLILLSVMTIMAILTKLIGCWIGARLTGFDSSSSFSIGAGMISRGEVALIIASTGLQAKLLSEEYFTPLVIMIIITTLLTPLLLKITMGHKQLYKQRQEKSLET